MRIKLNGKAEEVSAGSVSDLLSARKIEPRLVSVEINENPVAQEQFHDTLLKEGDSVEVLFFMGGGA